MRVVLISTYDLGRQPFGLASPAAWLRRAGCEVRCVDVSRDRLDAARLAEAELVAFHLPMHTATRLALRLLPQVQTAAPGAHMAAYGLYAPMNRKHLHDSGFDSVLGPESEAELVELAGRLAGGQTAARAASAAPAALPRLEFLPPDRSDLPALARYAQLRLPDGEARIAGFTEASRGCKHRCRHCPIVPVYDGKFRIVAPEVVLADIRQQVAAGAAHISFGDPDFFNGITHARRVVSGLHREFPGLSYDVTIKVEHLLRHREALPLLRDTGCVLITTAVESLDDAVLARLEKGHTRADFVAALELTRQLGLALNATFVSFTPWTTAGTFHDQCATLASAGLEAQVAPVQYGVRLLIPAGSRVLELPDRGVWLGEFDAAALSYAWRNPDPAVEELCEGVQSAIGAGTRAGHPRALIFAEIAAMAAAAAGAPTPAAARARTAAPVPYFDEPWFCCSEPTAEHFARMSA